MTGIPIGSIIRGGTASAVGTLAMDTLLYRRYRAGGGESDFLAWNVGWLGQLGQRARPSAGRQATA